MSDLATACNEAELKSEITRLNGVIESIAARVRRFEAEREIQNDMIDKLIEALKS